MEKLFAAIDAEPVRKPRKSFDLAGRVAVFVSSISPRNLAWAGSAAMLAIVLQVAVIATSLVKDQAAQHTVLASMQGNNTSLAIVRFAPKAELVNITKFLEVNKASVIEGPKVGAIYTIRLPVSGRGRNDLIKQMRTQSTIVDFIASVQ